MTEDAFDLSTLNLELAWKRVCAELPYSFVRFPYELPQIELDLDGWIEEVRRRLRAGSYRPSTAIHFDTPKKGWMIRPGSYVSLEDRMVFTACVGFCEQKIRQSIEWSQGTHDFGWILTPPLNAPVWLRNPRYCWRLFSNRALRLLRDPKYPVILSTDIVGFYENISIETLNSDLAQLELPSPITNLIRDSLRTWTPSLSGDQGLPQNVGACHLLAKFYIDPIDRFLARGGYVHHRYVDDVMIYCTDVVHAKRAIADLSRWLRARSLTLHGEKSQILSPDVARLRFEGALDKIARVLDTAVQDEVQAEELSNPYLNVEEITAILEPLRPEVDVRSYEAALRLHFTDTGDSLPPFDKSFFHFLLGGLAKANSRAAVDFSISLLASRPEETPYILNHLKQLGIGSEFDAQVNGFLLSSSAVYPYQVYQVGEWVLNRVEPPAGELTDTLRRLAWEPATPSYLRATCKAILGKWGDPADLERLWESYSDTGMDAERATTVIALGRLERGRRNAFYSAIERRSSLEYRAARLARSLCA